jgi:uncharacterized phage protein (TIGR02220 family)
MQDEVQYLHIKNLEKYHPGYKDRKLRFAKIFFDMVQGDPDCELIDNEIDWGRLIKFIILELQAQAPIPLIDSYLTKKGFDLRKRPIRLTIQMLHNFVDIVTEEKKTCSLDKEKDKEKEEEKERSSVTNSTRLVNSVFDYFLGKTKKRFQLTQDRRKLIKGVLEAYSENDCKRAIDNFVNDPWPDRKQHLDPKYCFKLEKFEKWVNQKPIRSPQEKIVREQDTVDFYFKKGITKETIRNFFLDAPSTLHFEGEKFLIKSGHGAIFKEVVTELYGDVEENKKKLQDLMGKIG